MNPNDIDDEATPYVPEEVANAAADAEVPKRQRRQQAPEPKPTPYSEEGEQHVIAALLLDESGETFAKCTESRISGQSFHLPANRLIFETLARLHQAKLPTTIETLAEQLSASGSLEKVGGFPYLMQVSGKVPTTAHVSFFVKRLRDLDRLRQLIRAASIAQESAYLATEADGVVDEAFRSIQAIAQNRSGLDLLEGRDYNRATRSKKPSPIFTAAGTTICTPGNITTFYAQAKVGKTAATSAMLASTMLIPGSVTDCLGFAGANPEGHAVIHLDTEQARYDWEQMVENALRRAKADALPSWLMPYHLTGMGAPQIRSLIRPLLTHAAKRHKKVRALFIDGIGDLVVNPNDPEECFPLITELHAMAIEFDCAIIAILHMNAGSENEKGRGHLGSQLERKSESNITMAKDDSGVTRYWATKQRGKMISKSDAPAFRWSDEAGMHVSCDAPEPTRKHSGGRKRSFDFDGLSKFLGVGPKAGKTQPMLMREITSSGPTVSKTALYELLQDCLSQGMIRADRSMGDVRYHL